MVAFAEAPLSYFAVGIPNRCAAGQARQLTHCRAMPYLKSEVRRLKPVVPIPHSEFRVPRWVGPVVATTAPAVPAPSSGSSGIPFSAVSPGGKRNYMRDKDLRKEAGNN